MWTLLPYNYSTWSVNLIFCQITRIFLFLSILCFWSSYESLLRVYISIAAALKTTPFVPLCPFINAFVGHICGAYEAFEHFITAIYIQCLIFCWKTTLSLMISLCLVGVSNLSIIFFVLAFNHLIDICTVSFLHKLQFPFRNYIVTFLGIFATLVNARDFFVYSAVFGYLIVGHRILKFLIGFRGDDDLFDCLVIE